MRLDRLRLLLLGLWLTASPLAGAGELLVAANLRCGIERLTSEQVVNYFMGRHRALPSGVPVYPIDQPGELREQFYRKLMGKELAEINAYWARLVFSGKVAPPTRANRPGEAAQWISQRLCGLGYITAAELNDRMKVVLVLP